MIKELFSSDRIIFSQLIETIFFYDKREVTVYDLNEIFNLKKKESLNNIQKLIIDLNRLNPIESVVSDTETYELELMKNLKSLVKHINDLIEKEVASNIKYTTEMYQFDKHKKILSTVKNKLYMVFTQPDRSGIDNYFGDINRIFSSIMKIYFGYLLRINSLNAKDKDNFWIEIIEYSNSVTKDYKLKYLEKSKMIVSNKVSLVEIKSVSDFISELDKFENENLFFRGHSKINYKLIPSIFRGFQSSEYSMIQDLRIALPNEFNRDMNHFDMLLKMQHYELPTRLLDLTTNPLVALYFAASNDNNYYGEVKLITTESEQVCYPNSDRVRMLSAFAFIKQNQKKDIIYQIRNNKKQYSMLQEKYQQPLIHEIRTYVPAFEPRILIKDMIKPIIIKSPNANLRISAQSGSFIISAMDQFQHKELDVKTLKIKTRQIILLVDKNSKRKILKQLSKLNINKGTMFPEIAEKSKFIKEKYLGS